MTYMADFLFELPKDEEKLRRRLLPRRKLLDRSLIADVSSVFEDVASSGDKAIREATRRFDGIGIPAVAVSDEFLENSVSGLSPQLRNAVETAIANIAEVNEALMPEPEWRKQIRPGTVIG